MEIKTQKDLERLKNLARRFYYGPQADIEDIIGECLLNYVRKNQRVTTQVIRNKCIDKIRRNEVENKHKENIPKHKEAIFEEIEKEEGLVNRLMKQSLLTRLEQRVLYLRFWENLSVEEINDLVPNTRQILHNAIEKLRFGYEVERMKNEGI